MAGIDFSKYSDNEGVLAVAFDNEKRVSAGHMGQPCRANVCQGGR